MLATKRINRGWLVLLGLLVGAGGTAAQSGSAQQASDGGYAVTEDGDTQAPDAIPPAGAEENNGPVRLARFSYVQGNVTWRTDEDSEWSAATLNLPLRQGAQIWVTGGGRAEIQFDDGSLLRLGNGAVVTLQTLYSDADGEFTELKMTEGLASLRLRHDRGVYQVNTPLASVKAAGPATLRLGVGDGLEVALKSGRATVEGAQGKADLESGDFLDLLNSNSRYTVREIPLPDSWDRWNKDRDDVLAHAESEPAQEHLPSDIAIVAGNLNDYGSWRNDSEDGWVWCPRVSDPTWRPYYAGHWTWVNPFGWTWVSDEAWGWAPYHYGTWINRPYGWAWCPGPVHQYWSPAVVHFSECDGRVAWCPLAPTEVRYPTVLSIGFRRGNWSTYFSIGGAAVYYPTAAGYCAPRRYDTRYVNRVTYIGHVTTATNLPGNPSYNRFAMSQEGYAANHNTYLNGSVFIPVNSRTAAGVTTVASNDFGGRATYVPVNKADTSLFARGRVIAAPVAGKAPLAGPVAVKPTPQAMTPTRTFTQTAQTPAPRQNQPVFRAPVRSTIVQNSAPITPTGRVLTPPQTGYIRPNSGVNNPGGFNRSDRATSNGGNNGNGFGLNQQRGQVQPRGGDGSQSIDKGRTDGSSPRQGYYLDRRPGNTGNGNSGSGNSASDSAAAARNSLGIPGRNRANGGSSDGSTTVDKSPRYNGYTGGSNGNGGSSNTDRNPRYNGNSGSDGTPRYNGGNSGSGNTPRYNGGTNSNGSSGNSNQPPRYNGYSGNGNGGSSNGNGSGSGNTDRNPRYNGNGSDGTPRYNGGGNSGSDRSPRYNGYPGNGGSSSGNSGSSPTPRYNGNSGGSGNSGSSPAPRSNGNSGSSSGSSGSSGGGQNSSGNTPRQNPPSPPPSRNNDSGKGSDSNKDSGKDSGSKGSDSNNRGRGRN